jgi:hypothetical protein
MSSTIINLVISLLMLASLLHIFKTPIVKYINVRKRKARREDLFYINPRIDRREHLRNQFNKLNRIFFLTRQNNQVHEDDVKLVFGKVFELDNSIDVDTKIDVSIWARAYHSAQNNKITSVYETIVQFVKSTSLFIHHRLKSMIKRVNKLQKAVTKYIHNNGGDDNHGQRQRD